MFFSVSAFPALVQHIVCGRPTAEQRVAEELRDSHKASYLDRSVAYRNLFDRTVVEDQAATTFGQVFVAPSAVEHASHIVAHNFDAARVHKGVQAGKAAGLHQTLNDPGHSPMHTVVMKFSSFPPRDECRRIIEAHVKAGVADKTVPPEFAAALRSSMTRDLLSLRSAAGKAGGKVDGFECVLRYQFVPGAASGGTGRNNVALSEWCALKQGVPDHPVLHDTRPAIYVHAPSLALGLDAFKAMPDLKRAYDQRQLTPAVALKSVTDNLHDERVARLTGAGQTMTTFVNAYIDSSKTNELRQKARQRGIDIQRAVKAPWPLTMARNPNFIDAHHFAPGREVVGGTSTDHLMGIARQWKPSTDRATNAYRFAWIMNVYAPQMEDTNPVQHDSAETASTGSGESWASLPARFATGSGSHVYHHYETIDDDDAEVSRLMAPSEREAIVVKPLRPSAAHGVEPVSVSVPVPASVPVPVSVRAPVEHIYVNDFFNTRL